MQTYLKNGYIVSMDQQDTVFLTAAACWWRMTALRRSVRLTPGW